MSCFHHLVLCLILMGALGRCAWGLETDQFTVPPKPLVDLGSEFDRLVLTALGKVADEANARFGQLIDQTNAARNPAVRERCTSAAAACLSDGYIAYRLFKLLGDDDGSSLNEALCTYHSPAGGPTVFDPSLNDTIYGNSPFTIGLRIIPMSPTIRVHGVYFGTDKVGHFFQQGYQYYDTYFTARREGQTHEQAVRTAVERGVGQEHGIFGEAVDGIYSNGDVAADYAGLQFYINLTRPIRLGGDIRPAILILKDARWQLNPETGSDFLRYFISDHFNEALNPSHYVWYLRSTIRGNIATRGKDFVAFYHLTRDLAAQQLDHLRTWYGADYGHSGGDGLFTIVNSYFERR